MPLILSISDDYRQGIFLLNGGMSKHLKTLRLSTRAETPEMLRITSLKAPPFPRVLQTADSGGGRRTLSMGDDRP